MYCVRFGWKNMEFEKYFMMFGTIKGVKCGGVRPNCAHIFRLGHSRPVVADKNEMDNRWKVIDFALHPVDSKVTYQNDEVRRAFMKDTK